MRFSVLRKMLPKLVGLYTWRIQMPPMDGRGGGGWKCGKFIVTNILIDRKKLWLVSHKMRKNRVSKVLRKMRKRTFLGMLPSLRIYATFYAGGVLLMYIQRYDDISSEYFLISNGIFLAEKCPTTDLRSFQPWTFGFFVIIEISDSQRNIFGWKVSNHIISLL